jgi:cytochrome c biogenesis protein ResB
MSLKNPDDEYDELITPKKGVFQKFKNPFKKMKFLLVLLIVGIIIGILLGHYYIEPLLTNESNVCKNCVETNQLLSKENECLYTLIPNSQFEIATCLTNDEN